MRAGESSSGFGRIPESVRSRRGGRGKCLERSVRDGIEPAEARENLEGGFGQVRPPACQAAHEERDVSREVGRRRLLVLQEFERLARDLVAVGRGEVG